MKNKKTILFTIPNLDSLGAQRVLLTLLKFISFGEEYQIKLLVISNTGNFKNDIPKHIEVISAEKYIMGVPKFRVIELLIYGFYRAISDINPLIVISLVPFTNFASFLPKLIFKLKYKLIVSEHAHVSAAIADKENMGNYFQKLYLKSFKWVYNSKLVDKIIVIAQESKDDLELNHNIDAKKMYLINNPVDINLVREKAELIPEDSWFNSLISAENFIIINSGRLVYQKRQDILIKAFAKLYKKYNNIRLVILGGGDKTLLTNLIEELDLNKVVTLAGFQSNPWSFIARSNLFVLSSCWEGLPCVIAETMALNIPIVSTNCPSGPQEMLDYGKLGLLAKVDNVDSIAEKIEEAMMNQDFVKKMAKLASDEINRYEPQFIAEKYEKLIRNYL